MIAVDSSVLVAVAVDEPGAADFTTIVLSTPCIASWATVFETRMVLSDRGKEALRILEDWIVRPNVTLDPFDAPQYRDAVIAFERFGRGRHPAKLNFGDCMSYAVAKHHGVPLLYKGNDFRLTDIRSALP